MQCQHRNGFVHQSPYQYQELFYNLVTSKSDNATFNKEYAEKQLINIPDVTIQQSLIKTKCNLEIIRKKIEKTIDTLNELIFNSKLNFAKSSSAALGNVFYIKGGNSGLVEKFIYYNQPVKRKESIPIFSSATLQINMMGNISENAKIKGKCLKIFEGPCILIARNGYAGKMTFIDTGKFVTNDHAYVLTPKKEWQDKINLRWFAYQYQELFYNLVTSKSDNATFNKEYAEKQKTDFPEKEFQDNFANKLIKIDKIIAHLEHFKNKVDFLMENKVY